MMFTKEQIAERGFYTQYFEQGKQENTLIMNMGPQHPSTHGVLRVMLEIDGEYILRADPVLGYIHRMHEKMAEVKTYAQFITNMGRVDYLHALAWNWAFVGAVEKLGGTPPSHRAEYLRVITCELNRISSHLLWWGAYLLDLGAFTPILYAFDDREELLDIMQDMTGSRLTYASFTFGGVVADMDEALKVRIKRFIERLRERLPMYKSLVTDNFILLGRVEDIGNISKDMAVRYGVTGPVLRGSGVAYDVRRAEPYSVYPELDFIVPTSDRTDALGGTGAEPLYYRTGACADSRRRNPGQDAQKTKNSGWRSVFRGGGSTRKNRMLPAKRWRRQPLSNQTARTEFLQSESFRRIEPRHASGGRRVHPGQPGPCHPGD
jgi:NADH-quinone oxidoreductase subunit D